MNKHILIAYATKHGSTHEVAEAIATALRTAGHRVDVADAADVREVNRYATVIIGGALYMGHWHRDAVAFLKRHERALAHIPLGVFAMGPKTLAEADVASARAQLDHALASSPLEPASVAIFGGVVDPSKLHFPLNRMPASDARDWTAIEAWAAEVGEREAHRTETVVA
jgi:menaquinone-dependent protoporphyrinogen oxidase